MKYIYIHSKPKEKMCDQRLPPRLAAVVLDLVDPTVDGGNGTLAAVLPDAPTVDPANDIPSIIGVPP